MTVERLRPYSVNVFAAMSALAAEVGAVNLGQGFPDEDGPPAMLEVARQAIADGVNQYPPGPGIAPLRQAIAAQRLRRYGTDFNPDSEVLVTVGASEAIAAACCAWTRSAQVQSRFQVKLLAVATPIASASEAQGLPCGPSIA